MWLALRALALHPLAARKLARDLLYAAEAITLRVAVRARGLHRVDAGGLVVRAGRGPRLAAGDGADGLLRCRVSEQTGGGVWRGRTSTAPLTYWTCAPTSDVELTFVLVVGLVDMMRMRCDGS
jgi:hypothetical protein